MPTFELIRIYQGTPSSCYPAATGLGSSFDVELLEKVGSFLADECKAKGEINFVQCVSSFQ